MSEHQNFTLNIVYKDEPVTQGQWEQELYDKGERMMRALQTMLLMWLVGAVCILIPIAHFFLVPGFLVIGLVFGWMKLQVHQESKKMQGTCPHCKKTLNIDLDGANRLPYSFYCPHCDVPLKAERNDT